MSGTSKGHIEVGDMVVVKRISPEELKVGDVIAFKSNQSTVVHRIVEIKVPLCFVTKGDANNINDIEPVKAENVVGRVIARLPKFGNILLFLKNHLALICITCLLIFLLDSIIHKNIEK